MAPKATIRIRGTPKQEPLIFGNPDMGSGLMSNDDETRLLETVYGSRFRAQGLGSKSDFHGALI